MTVQRPHHHKEQNHEHSLDGWDIGHHSERDWSPWGGTTGDARAKVLAVADDYYLTLVEAQPGYAGDAHEHAHPEFLYVIDGSCAPRASSSAPATATPHRRVRSTRLRHRNRRHLPPHLQALGALRADRAPASRGRTSTHSESFDRNPINTRSSRHEHYRQSRRHWRHAPTPLPRQRHRRFAYRSIGDDVVRAAARSPPQVPRDDR